MLYIFIYDIGAPNLPPRFDLFTGDKWTSLLPFLDLDLFRATADHPERRSEAQHVLTSFPSQPGLRWIGVILFVFNQSAGARVKLDKKTQTFKRTHT